MADLGCRRRPISWQRAASPRKAFGCKLDGGEELAIRARAPRARSVASASSGSEHSAASWSSAEQPTMLLPPASSDFFHLGTGLGWDSPELGDNAHKVVRAGSALKWKWRPAPSAERRSRR